MSARPSMVCAGILYLMLPLAAHSDGIQRCEELFNEPSAIATCNTIARMNRSISDQELRERVSQTVYGVSADQLPAIKEKIEAERRAAKARKEAEEKNERCYILFGTTRERDICRQVNALTMYEKTDEELKEAVRKRTQEQKVEAERKRKATLTKLNAMLSEKPLGFSFDGWSLGGFDTVLIVRFTLQNNSTAAMRDFVLECTTYGNSGTALNRRQQTLYEKLEPGKKASFDLNMGLVNTQSAKASCHVAGWVPH
ncbi:MAG: hypothetical protein ACOZDY_10990 [Pseudomonadota bacterium]